MPKVKYPQLKEGDIYNDLKILKVYQVFKEGKKYGRKFFDIECICGGLFSSDAANIMGGHTKSCGCLHKTVTGFPKVNHGLSETPTYYSWKSMISRCINPTEREFKFYGDVEICERWLLFENFLEDMGERPEGTSLDRIDGTLGYFMDNCRWADRTTQSYNQKMQSNNKSGCVGVSWHKGSQKWLARISKNRRIIHLGLFIDFEEACRVRKEAELKYYGYNV